LKIAVVGTGYVGLVAGACLAEGGHDVVCADIDASKIARLRRGECPIYEPGLEEIVQRNQREGRLRFTTDLADAARPALVVFIAVGTPPKEDGSADLRHVLDVAAGLARAMDGGGCKVVVVKSTVPIGTCDRVRAVIEAYVNERGGADFDVVSNPEFLKEGAAVDDFMRPDRVVCGVASERARLVMEEIYRPYIAESSPLLFMDVRSSEMTKYAANAMLATRISFMNEIANLCERLGADVANVKRGIGSDPRIGNLFLNAGIGYGGSCFPKDVKALIGTAAECGYTLQVLAAVDEVNDRQKETLLAKVRAHFGTGLAGRRIAIWGLAFKPNTDDMREAPSQVVIDGLLAAGAQVTAFDPVAHETARVVFGDRITYAVSAYDALEGADALLLVTEWSEFRAPDYARMKSRLRAPVVFDGRNLWEPARLRELGFTYFGTGRG